VGISANSRDTSHLYITRNEIWNTGGTGEGMYLGGNNASVVMSRSVIALNHVHDTLNGVTQGDGIEVKQGSWGNWIVGNHVHDCNYPCIVVYGSGGKPVNIVEGNVCYRSNDNTMQIQGECEVRNNLVMSATGSAFASQPHQGEPTGLRVVHNTFINRGTAVKLTGWGRGEDMQFANNVCYSKAGWAMRIMQGSGNAAFVGNVVVGEVSDGLSGFNSGRGLEDFVGVDWDGMQRDARPSARSMFRGVADEAYAVGVDLDGEARTPPHSAGCYR
jgi:hypothetical protein